MFFCKKRGKNYELKPEKPSDMGKLMGFVTPKLKGKADMSFVSKTIKEKLANL